MSGKRRRAGMLRRVLPATVGVLAAGIAVLVLTGSAGSWRFTRRAAWRTVENMGGGINIGNSLDAHSERVDETGVETYWGNPRIDAELFRTIAGKGFRTVRIPVTWQGHMDGEGTVSEFWMSRVQEVVDEALEAGLYVILDTHHEEWLSLIPENEEAMTQRFTGLWRQIAERFAEYPETLLFEGMNEPRLRDSDIEWSNGTPELRQMVDRLNRAFVKTVRGSGGKNKDRFCLITTYASRCEAEALEGLTVPDWRCIVSVHAYTPYTFCQDEDGETRWDEGWRQRFRKNFENLRGKLGNVPAVITEFGCKDKDNLADRETWLRAYTEEAAAQEIPCVWWDNGSDYALLDRESDEWLFPSLAEILAGGTE